MQVGATEVGAAQECTSEISAAQLSIHQPRPRYVSFAQTGRPKLRTLQPGLGQVAKREARAVKAQATQVGITQVHVSELRAAKVDGRAVSDAMQTPLVHWSCAPRLPWPAPTRVAWRASF